MQSRLTESQNYNLDIIKDVLKLFSLQNPTVKDTTHSFLKLRDFFKV